MADKAGDGHEVSTGMMSGMDPDLVTFLQTNVNSFLKWDLVRFFHDNPHTVGTVENIALHTGRNENATRAELDELVASGMLAKDRVSRMDIYSLASDPEARRLLNRFVRASCDRQFRVKAIYRIIRDMQ